ELGQGLGKRFADQVMASDKCLERVVRDREAKVGSFNQRHKARCVLEHHPEPLSAVALLSTLLQHGFSIQQRGRSVITIRSLNLRPQAGDRAALRNSPAEPKNKAANRETPANSTQRPTKGSSVPWVRAIRKAISSETAVMVIA